ncbi:MAG: glycosyltransferase family 2 protein [Planctomycetota bacterium]
MGGDPSGAPRVQVVLVHWNRPALTVRCLESLLGVDYPSFAITVCDNGSATDARAALADWVRGSATVAWRRRDAVGEVRQSGGPAGAVGLDLVEIGRNLGFAGACNAGMRLAFADPGCRYVWLLNNDTTVDPRALAELVAEMGRRPAAGFGGSTVLLPGPEERVQALGGGTYSPWLGRVRLFARARRATGEVAEREARRVRRRLDFVVATSMLVDRRVWERVGPMDEGYFLYFEELDWIRRARGAFDLAFAPRSIVVHDVGGTIGTSVTGRERSLLAEYYGVRNRLRFTRRHHAPWLPAVLLGVLATSALRLARGQPGRAAMILALARAALGLAREEEVCRRYLGAADPRRSPPPAPGSA